VNEFSNAAHRFGRQRWPVFVLGALIALYVAYFSWYTLTASSRCQTEGFDLAIYDQAVWNTIHGRWFRSTYEPGYDNLLADHVEPILLPISLLYFVWDSANALLVLQTIVLALGALPVYWLARDALRAALYSEQPSGQRAPVGPADLGSPVPIQLSALAFALVYLLQPALHSANLYEFHPSALAICFLLFALYFMRKRQVIPFFVFIVLTMSTKEVMPLTTLAVGLYILAARREWLVGVVTSALSVAWFLLALFVVVPHFNPGGQSLYFSFAYYSWLGSSEGDILVRLITHPGLILQRVTSQTGPAYLAGLLGPVAYVSLLGLPVLLLASPALILNALSQIPPQHSSAFYYHYAVAIVPFVVVGAIDGVAFLTRSVGPLIRRLRPATLRLARPRSLVAILLSALILAASLVAQRQHGYLPFSRDFYLAADSERATAIKEIAAEVPPEASVSSAWYAAPFLSHREDLFYYPDELDADYQLVDVSYRIWPIHPRDRYDAIRQTLQDGQYGVRDGRYGYLLLERGLDQPIIPDSFYDFARAEAPSPQYSVTVDFDELRLIGFDLGWDRAVGARAHLVFYWQALRPVERDLRLFFIQTDSSGEPLPGTEMEFVQPVWYPPSRWSPSEVIRTETFHWPVEEPGKFGVAIGVVEGPGFWDLDQRVRPVVQSAPWGLPLIHGESLLWPATLSSDGQLVTLEKPGE
jgi:uncharacterized membrane protein